MENGFIRHDDAAFGQQILDIPEAEAVSVIHETAWLMISGGELFPKVPGGRACIPALCRAES